MDTGYPHFHEFKGRQMPTIPQATGNSNFCYILHTIEYSRRIYLLPYEFLDHKLEIFSILHQYT